MIVVMLLSNYAIFRWRPSILDYFCDISFLVLACMKSRSTTLTVAHCRVEKGGLDLKTGNLRKKSFLPVLGFHLQLATYDEATPRAHVP